MSRVQFAVRDGRIRFGRIPLRRTLLEILADHSAAGVLSVAIVDDAEIRRVHREFLDDDTPTDVISFPLRESNGSARDEIIGEVVLSAETAFREARRRRLPPERELVLYAIHGTLHIVGLDDVEPASAKEMRRAEKRYLARHDGISARPRSSRRPEPRRPRRKPRPAPA